MTIVRSPRAVDDVFAIWSYIAERDETAADALIDRIDEKLRRLEIHPLLGPNRSGFGPGIRSLTSGRYVLWYRPIANGIELVRVLHGARDLHRDHFG